MTEKKKYTSNFDGAIRINNKELVAYANSEINAQYLCKLLNEQEEKIKELKDELFSVTSALIYETSTNPRKEIEEAKKEIYGKMMLITEDKECVYFNSVLGVCDIDGITNCPCENYEGDVE